MATDLLDVKLKAITPIWTGDVNQKGKNLHNSGIIGSLRWWYEAIVRGLGGYACDPTEGGCKLDGNETSEAERKSKICPVCHLFGCTGWQRKFRLEIREDNDGKPGCIKMEAIQEKDKFWLRFINIKDISLVEKSLICATLSISSKYGSIGGRTVFKPSEIPWKNSKKNHHYDYGLFLSLSDLNEYKVSKAEVTEYFNNFSKKSNDSLWPDLRCFWFVLEKTINRAQLNQIVHRSTQNSKVYDKLASDDHQWLGGETRKSKKIFAFHTSGAQRTWGYLKNDDSRTRLLNDILNGIEWDKNEENQVEFGEVILSEYF